MFFFKTKTMKLHKKQAEFISNISVSVAMTIVMTGGMLYFHSGFCPNFFTLWFSDFLLGNCIAIPTGLLVVPVLTKFIAKRTISD